jgi:peptidoglycan/xylan/chitin deacetylase (PgdA/CDA1 family)
VSAARRIDGTTLLAAGLSVAAAAVLAHAAPALTSITPLRRRLWPHLSGIGDPGHVAVTFDDGPDRRSTPAFLHVLATRRVHATFFVLGRMLARTPQLGLDMVAAGHEIALHGWEHDLLLHRTPQATYTDLARGRDLIAEITGAAPRWWRPPSGVLTAPALVAAARLDLTPVLWTAWGRDWTATATPASVLDHVERGMTGGGTIQLHDSDCTSAPGSWKATLGALPQILSRLQRRGLRVGPLREHGRGWT